MATIIAVTDSKVPAPLERLAVLTMATLTVAYCGSTYYHRCYASGLRLS